MLWPVVGENAVLQDTAQNQHLVWFPFLNFFLVIIYQSVYKGDKQLGRLCTDCPGQN